MFIEICLLEKYGIITRNISPIMLPMELLLPKYALLRPNMLYYAQICFKMPKYALLCLYILYYARIYSIMPIYALLCPNMLYACIVLSAIKRSKEIKKTRCLSPGHCHDGPLLSNIYLVRNRSACSYVSIHLQ